MPHPTPPTTPTPAEATVAAQVATEAPDALRDAARSLSFDAFLAAHSEQIRALVVARAQRNIEIAGRLLADRATALYRDGKAGGSLQEFEAWALPRIYRAAGGVA
jgi:hypothetical protein